MRTLILEESGDFKYLCHLYHFVELLLVAFAEIEQRGWARESIEAISMPHWSQPNWRGKQHDHNLVLLRRLFPRAVVSTAQEGPRITPTESIVIDRGRLKPGPSREPQVSYIQQFNAAKWFAAIHGEYRPNPEPVVTYITRQRQESRALHPVIHQRLVDQLQMLPGIFFQMVAMEDLTFDQQLMISRQTDVLLGVHGNGLTHAMFMHPRRFVCEIFTPGWNHEWHYYSLSRAMGHDYLCMFDGVATHPARFRLGKTVCRSHSLETLDVLGFVQMAVDQQK